MTDAEKIVALTEEVEKLKQSIIAAAQWCGDGCCEFKTLRMQIPQFKTLDEAWDWVYGKDRDDIATKADTVDADPVGDRPCPSGD